MNRFTHVCLPVVYFFATTGCSKHDNRASLCEVFADAAYEVAITKAELTPDEPQPAPQKCCSECKNTGKVQSGDKLSWVDCECQPSCGCRGVRELVREVK